MSDRASSRRLAALIAVAFVPAWFLTAVHTTGELVGGRSSGWQAFLFAASPLFGGGLDGGMLIRAWTVTSALSNLLLVVTIVLLAWRPALIRGRLGWALAVSCAVNAYWLVLPGMLEDLRVGYYLWLASFVMAAVALWSRRTTPAGRTTGA